MTPIQAKLTLTVTLLISFLGTAGIALPYPVLAPYFLDEPANTLTHFLGWEPKILLGIALSLYPLGMLIGSSFIGGLSDIYGRRFILIITLAGTVFGYLLTAYAVIIESYPLFLFARLISGICEGNISIARAMAADLHPHIDKVRAMSLLFATVYAGWLFGPLAGGYLMPLGVDWVFTIAALATLLTMLVVFLGVQKRDKRPEETRHLGQLIIQENSFSLLKHKQIWPLFSFYFIYTLGINLFYEFFPVWLVEELGYHSKQIAWMTVVLTSCMIGSSILFATKVVYAIGKFKSLVLGCLFLPLCMMSLVLANETFVYGLFALMGMTIALNNAVTPTYMSDRFGHLGQGKVMGLQTSLFFLSNVIMAIIGSIVAMLNVDATMVVAALIIVFALGWLYLSGEVKELTTN